MILPQSGNRRPKAKPKTKLKGTRQRHLSNMPPCLMNSGSPPQLSTTSTFSDKQKLERRKTCISLEYTLASAQFTHRLPVVVYPDPRLKKILASDVRIPSPFKDEKISSPSILHQFPLDKPLQRDELMKLTLQYPKTSSLSVDTPLTHLH
jgi:hypothetical protein